MQNLRVQNDAKAANILLSPWSDPSRQKLYNELLTAAYEELARARPIKQLAHNLSEKLIVSLTSHSARFETLSLTLESLFRQTCAADLIVLWIAHEDIQALPQSILDLRNEIFAIKYCRDLQPGNKLIPSLSEYENNYIVTCDDDTFYPKDWLETLVKEVDLNHQEIIGTRAHLAFFDSCGRALPYLQWDHVTSLTTKPGPLVELFLTGVGGVLYPPRCFDPRVKDAEAYLSLCPRADDIWFFSMAQLAGTPRRRTARKFDLISWPRSQDCGLVFRNVGRSENDSQMAAVEGAFPELLKIRLNG
jgi:hypothetical protein